MLKDSSQNPAELLRGFFSAYYGKAADGVEKFFSVARGAWDHRGDNPRWLGLFKRLAQSEILDSYAVGEMECALSKAEKSAESRL